MVERARDFSLYIRTAILFPEYLFPLISSVSFGKLKNIDGTAFLSDISTAAVLYTDDG